MTARPRGYPRFRYRYRSDRKACPVAHLNKWKEHPQLRYRLGDELVASEFTWTESFNFSSAAAISSAAQPVLISRPLSLMIQVARWVIFPLFSYLGGRP
jgi:hypothetical protein